MLGRFIITKISTGEYTFELKAGNGEGIALSGTFPTVEGCENIIDSIRRNAKAQIEDRTVAKWKAVPYPKYEITRNIISGEFQFKLKSKTGELIAASEGYSTKSGCIKGIRSIGKNAPDCEIIVKE